MHFSSLRGHLPALLATALMLAVAGQAYSQDGPAAGVIRISDNGAAPDTMAPPAHRPQQQYLPGQPRVVEVGPGFEFDGNPLHDLCTSMQMKLHARHMRAHAERNGGCAPCTKCGSGKCASCRGGQCDGGRCAKGDCDNDYDGIDSDGDGYDYDRDDRGARFPGYGERYTEEQWRQNLETFKHRYGYFIPHGQVPVAGHYGAAYAVNPDYWDKRDSGPLYSAEGYGVPVAVPLPPVVNRSYNYGWGIPSSRLTPISRLVPQQQLPPVR
ncbi:MAG: hypothetical protein KDA79_15580 [Planctomycetaceae bacterium]|nr:hypothetical protein [Planctomycetaceae bacterium]